MTDSSAVTLLTTVKLYPLNLCGLSPIAALILTLLPPPHHRIHPHLRPLPLPGFLGEKGPKGDLLGP